jgi:hypothetical protein
MKKVLILFLTTLICTAGPYAIKAHAQETANPKHTLGFVTKILSATAETIIEPISSTETNNISQQKTETDKANSNSILLKTSQVVNEIVSSVQPENKAAGTSSADTKKQAVQSAAVNSETAEANQKIITQPENEVISVSSQGKAVPENQQSNPIVTVRLIGQNEGGKSSLLSAGLSLPVVGNVNVDLISKEQTAADENPSSYADLVGFGINHSPLLGTVKGDLLSSRQNYNGSSSGSLAAIYLMNLVGNTHLGVIETAQDILGDTIKTTSGLLITDLENPILGDIHLVVIEVAKTETPEYKEITSGLINANIDSPLIGEDHIGVFEDHYKETTESTPITEGSVIDVLQNKGSPQSLTLEEHNKKMETSSESAEEELTNDSSKMVLHKQFENHSTVLGKPNVPNSNDSSNPDVPLALFSVSSSSGGSSTASGFGGSASSGFGSGADALVDSVFQKEMELKSQVKFFLQELSDEWIMAPPNNPPQASFFLSY